MTDFPPDLLARPRPRDAVDRVRSRTFATASELAPMLAGVCLGVIACVAPLAGLTGLLIRCTLGLTALIALRATVRQLRRRSVWPPGLEEALGLYRAGDLNAADAGLQALLGRARLYPGFRSASLSWRALIALRRGQTARAQDLWAEVARSGHWKTRALRPVLSAMPGMLALAATLEGDGPRARRWLAEMPSVDALLGVGPRLLATVCLALREGDPAAALKLAHDGWPMAEATLSPAEIRALRTLASLAEPDPTGPETQTWRAGAQPGWPGELEYLAQGWPALSQALHGRGPDLGAHP